MLLCSAIDGYNKVRGKRSFRVENTSRFLIELKLVYSYKIEVANSKYNFGLHKKL